MVFVLRTKIKNWFKQEWLETKTLFKCLPAWPFAVLCAALIAMNFLANKGIVATSWLSMDAGIVVSWISFLAGDTLVKRFGAKAAIKINVAAICVQLIAILLLTIGAIIPWADPSTAMDGFDTIFSASLWPLAAGTGAFILAIVFDSFLSKFILTRFKDRTSFRAYAVASYGSTFIGQFLDNLLFALFFSVWQPWCDPSSIWLMALVGAVVELICQVVFSPVGYKIASNWRKNGIGNEYISLVKEAQEVNDDGTVRNVA